MSNVLAKLFIKNYKDVKNPKVREDYGKVSGIVGIISNLILCTMKIVIGLISASVAIIADGINNLADASSSVITLVGFKLASAPEDKDHPYGHARIEYLTGLVVSILIILIGALLLKSSVEKIIHPEDVDISAVTIAVLIIAIAIKLWQSFFYMGMGKAIDSLALKATATDSRNDVISTLVVLIGVLITKFTGLNVDGYLGCLVALFIIWSGISLVKETSAPLLGEAPDEDLVKDICTLATEDERVLGIHDLMVHNYGPGKVFASMHVEVDADGDIMESHDMIDNIEKTVEDVLHVHFVIHMDPIRINDPELQKIKTKMRKTAEEMGGISNLHDFRTVPGPTHTNVIFDAVISHDCSYSEEEIKAKLQEELSSMNPAYILVLNFDKEYAYVDASHVS